MTRFIFFDPICSQTRLHPPPHPPCFYLDVFFFHFLLSSNVHPLLPTSTFPSSHPGEVELAPGTWDVYFYLVYPLITASFLLKKEIEGERRKWRVQPLVAPSITFITLLIELTSLSNKNICFYGFIGLGISISQRALILKTFQAPYREGSHFHSYFLLCYIKSPLVTYWKFFHPRFSPHSHCKSLSLPLCHLLPPFSHCLSVWHMAVKAAHTESSEQVNKQAGINMRD